MNLSQMALRNKRNTEQEYNLQLFEKCNLTCNFCWQDRTTLVGLDTVCEKAKILCEMLDKDSHPTYVINIMGGEIFADDIFTEKMWDDYYTLCTEVDKHVKQKLNKDVTFSFVTNLVTDKVDEIRRLFASLREKGLKVKMSTSYDAKGRFNKGQHEKFKENIEKLRDEVSCVSILLTKPVIKQLLENKDEYFKYLYREGFYIYCDYYAPQKNYTLVGPSDKDLLEVFYFLVDNYPNVHPIKDWIENSVNFLSCRSLQLIMPDGTKHMCGKFQVDDKAVINFFKSKIQTANNDDIEDSFLNRWNCLECEYFSRCTLGCFVQHDFMKRGQLKECPFKLTFDKITKGKEVAINALEQHFGT